MTTPTPTTTDILICGAGLAGISAAYHLAVQQGIGDIILVDERPPLTLTSDKSTECYRNWWPGPGDTMIRLMNRSIDLLEQMADASGNRFGLNRRGYVFLTADEERAARFQKTAEEISALGAGPLRVHRPGSATYQPSPAEGYHDQPTGADLLLGTELVLEQFPFLNPQVKAMLHARRCGWLSAQQLGMYMLEEAKARGARLVEGRVTGVQMEGGRVTAVEVQQKGQTRQIATRTFVNAAGPLIKEVGAMLDVKLPVYNELHGKISFGDSRGVVPRDVPLMIWNDPVTLPWAAEEREELALDEETRWLLEQFPAGVHFRPEGIGQSDILLLLWTYHLEAREPAWPIDFDPEYPEVVIRGLSRMIPGLETYFNRMGRLWVDGGYYCKTRENRFLAGPLGVDGAYLIGALSGYGVMAGPAAGELLAAHVAGAALPDYAPAFTLARYDDPAYQALLDGWDATAGQL